MGERERTTINQALAYSARATTQLTACHLTSYDSYPW